MDSASAFAAAANRPLAAERAGELTAALAAAHAVGATAWPRLTVTVADLAHHLGRLLPEAVETPELLGRLAAADLYLALAALREVGGAALALDGHLAAGVERQLLGMGLSGDARAEVQQRLRIKLLVAGPDGQAPALQAYDGRAALRTWVHVIAARLALDLHRRGRPAAEVLAEEDAVFDRATALVSGGVEHKLVNREQRAALLEALAEVMAGLPDRERVLLRLHFVEGTSIDALAPLYQVHRATVARWLAAAREQLSAGLERALEARGLTVTDRTEVLGATMSHLGVSLSAFFREPR